MWLNSSDHSSLLNVLSCSYDLLWCTSDEFFYYVCMLCISHWIYLPEPKENSHLMQVWGTINISYLVGLIQYVDYVFLLAVLFNTVCFLTKQFNVEKIEAMNISIYFQLAYLFLAPPIILQCCLCSTQIEQVFDLSKCLTCQWWKDQARKSSVNLGVFLTGKKIQRITGYPN